MLTIKNAVLGSAFLFVSILNLTACGGGSGNSAPTEQTGQFIDSPVEGLRYSTPTKSGTTNSNGEFQYMTGETVTFYIGDFLLGSATGAARITPFELAGISIPVTSAEVSRAINDFYAANEGDSNNTPLNVALNMATLMQTIDLDGDPNNGLTIPAAFVVLMNGQTLDFAQSYWDFEDALRAIIDLGNPVEEGGTDGIWGEYRDVISAPNAMNNMYAGLGLVPTQSKIVREARDSNNDGIIDYLELFAYDNQGNQIMYAEDNDGDGTGYNLEINYYEYNNNGRRRNLGYTEDSNGELPGGIVYFERWTYFDDPNVGFRDEQTYEEDNDGDGPEPMSRRIYDVNGNRIANETVTNNVVTYRETYQYDASQNLILSLVDPDGDGSGGVSERTVNTYVNNQLISTVTDAGSDSPDDDTSRMVYNYDANGRLISEETDGDGAGAGGISYRTVYAYGASGQRTLIERDADGDGAGVTSYRETWQYNANGRLILHTQDNDGDLTAAFALIETYAWNANNREILYERDINGDGVDYRRTATYNANNQIIQQVVDNDGDGTNPLSVLTTVYEYDASNRNTLTQTTNVNGITYRYIAAFHANGNRALTQDEYDSDGIYPTGSYGYRYEYNEMGRLTLQEYLRDGLASYRYGYVYDVNGMQTRYFYDGDGDGPNPANHYIGNTAFEVVENGTGVVTYRETYTTDSNGRRIRADGDADGDGSEGVTVVTNYNYDINGNQLLEETRTAGILTYRATWTYTNNYLLLSYVEESIGEGASVIGVSYRETNTYEDGRLVLEETDENGDDDSGLLRTFYIYDELGNRIRRERDGIGSDAVVVKDVNVGIYADGVIDSVTTYSYADVPVNWDSVLNNDW